MAYLRLFIIGLFVFTLNGCVTTESVKRKEVAAYHQGFEKGRAAEKEENIETSLENKTLLQWSPPIIQEIEIPAHIANGFYTPAHSEIALIKPGEWVGSEGPVQENQKYDMKYYHSSVPDIGIPFNDTFEEPHESPSEKQSGLSKKIGNDEDSPTVDFPINVKAVGVSTKTTSEDQSEHGEQLGQIGSTCLLQLKSGEFVSGKLVEKTDSFIRLHIMGLNKNETYYLNEIESINQSREKPRSPQNIIGAYERNGELRYKTLEDSLLKKKALKLTF